MGCPYYPLILRADVSIRLIIRTRAELDPLTLPYIDYIHLLKLKVLRGAFKELQIHVFLAESEPESASQQLGKRKASSKQGAEDNSSDSSEASETEEDLLVALKAKSEAMAALTKLAKAITEQDDIRRRLKATRKKNKKLRKK